jgi:hypothetical protein
VALPSKRKSPRLKIDAPHTKRLSIRAIEDQSVVVWEWGHKELGYLLEFCFESSPFSQLAWNNHPDWPGQGIHCSSCAGNTICSSISLLLPPTSEYY